MIIYGNNANSGMIHRENVQPEYVSEPTPNPEPPPVISPIPLPKTRGKYSYIVDGMTFSTVKQASDAFKINYSTLYDAFLFNRKTCKGHKVERVENECV